MSFSINRTRVAVAAPFIAALAFMLLGPIAAAGAQAAPNLPADPQQHGYIGLCNEAGANITGGSIDTKPFVWKAVSSSRPTAAYQGRGQNAVLGIYQPRSGVQASEWSGGSLTAASFYSTPAHPAVQATYADESLRDFMRQYPSQLNGLYALRFSYGKANYGLYRATYPVTTIQVTGSTWKVIHGGTVSCAKGKAVSNEQLTGVATKAQFTAHKPAATSRTTDNPPGHAISNAPTSVSGAGGGSGAGSGSTGNGGTQNAADSHSTSAASSTWLLWTVLGVGVLGIGALVVAARSRRNTTVRDRT